MNLFEYKTHPVIRYTPRVGDVIMDKEELDKGNYDGESFYIDAIGDDGRVYGCFITKEEFVFIVCPFKEYRKMCCIGKLRN